MNKNTKIAVFSAIALVLVCVAIILCVALTKKGGEKEVNGTNAVTTETPSTAVPETTNDAETTAETDEEKDPVLTNPLTGLPCEKDFSGKRPIAVMINNIYASLPQEGISNSDVVYECLAEGGITRMLMLFQDYEALGQVGSVRSARPYYIDFAQSHDAIYVHAGGSNEAYNQLSSRKIDHFDGVKGPSGYFYRDTWRLEHLSAIEHTMVTTGELITKAISDSSCRTTLRDNFQNPLNFVKYGTVDTMEDGVDALNVYIPYPDQKPYMKYDASTQKYLRYEYGQAQVDRLNNNKQLDFTNILVIFVTESPSNDEKNRINVETTGEGEGYYISQGKCINIKWSKKTADSEISFTKKDGTKLELNRGRSYIGYVDKTLKDQVLLNYNK